MYTSPDDDRSDLYLAGAVYVLGPTVLNILLDTLPDSLIAPVARPLGLVVTVATTVLVPFLLIRYRKQRFSEFGFDGSTPAFGWGLVTAVPVAAAYVIAGTVATGTPLGVAPVNTTIIAGAYVDLVLHVISVLCVVLLAVYTTVKARTAFRADRGYLRATALELVRYVAIAAAAATGLLVLTILVQGGSLAAAVEVLVVPLGVAGAVYLALRGIRNAQISSRPILLTPMVIMAIGSILIFGSALNFVSGIWRGAMLAGLGLVIGILMESRRSAWGPVGLGVGLALLTPLVG